jgi:hypothetical protein
MMKQLLIFSYGYHKNQGKLVGYSMEAEEQECQMILHYPAIHEVPKQEHHHQAPIPWLG